MDDFAVWFCPNDEWVSYDGDGYETYRSCGALCGETTFKALPEWAKQQLIDDGGVAQND